MPDTSNEHTTNEEIVRALEIAGWWVYYDIYTRDLTPFVSVCCGECGATLHTAPVKGDNPQFELLELLSAIAGHVDGIHGGGAG